MISLKTFNSQKERLLGKGNVVFSTILNVDTDGYIKEPSVRDMIHEVKSKMTRPFLSEKETRSLRSFLNFLEKNI